MNDDLELGNLVDKELNEVSVRGKDQLVYVPNNTMTDGYSIRGKYEVIGNTIHIKVSLFKGQKDRVDQFEINGSTDRREALTQKIVKDVEQFLNK